MESLLTGLVGMVVTWIVHAILAKFGVNFLPVAPIPGTPTTPAPGGLTLPSLPAPDGKGTLALALLQWIIGLRAGVTTATPHESALLTAIHAALPLDTPPVPPAKV